MYLISWEEGAERPGGWLLAKDKSLRQIGLCTFYTLAQIGLENDELLPLKELRTCKISNT
jgi:hypothetical protein